MRSGAVRVVLAAAVLLPASAIVRADGLVHIPPWVSATAYDVNTEGRGIVATPAGSAFPVVAVGYSSTGTTTRGIAWDPVNGTRQVLSGGWGFSGVTGLAYRNVGGSPQLVAHGLSAGWSAVVTSLDNGVTWQQGFRSVNVGSAPNLGTSGTLGALDTDDDVYVCWNHNANSNPPNLYTEHFAGSPMALVARDIKGVPTTNASRASATSSTSVRSDSPNPGPGITVGRRRPPSGVYQSYLLPAGGLGTQYDAEYMAGLDGTLAGEAWTISADGQRIFGMSPVLGGRAGNWPYMATVSFYEYDPVGNPGRFKHTQDAIVELPTLPGTTGSTTNALPYGCSKDGKYAVGMNYVGQARAVLWDTTANTIVDLNDVLGAKVAAAGFLRLEYGYAIYEQPGATPEDPSNLWITGRGVFAADLSNRGFVAVIGPAELQLTQGACCAPGNSRYTLEAGCTAPGVFTQNQTLAVCPVACCSRADASCSDVPPATCTANNGAGKGFNTDCALTQPICTGACCNAYDGTCSDVAEDVCTAAGGTFKGIGTTCATTTDCAGACCSITGCALDGPGHCTEVAGTFKGLGTVCDANSCVGACCGPKKACSQTDITACAPADFKGVGVACSGSLCPCSSSTSIWADDDLDGDVDMDDFGQFQRCFAGTDNVVGAGCECLNKVNDGTIDGADFIEFMNCATGAEVQWTQLLTPSCTP